MLKLKEKKMSFESYLLKGRKVEILIFDET